ncbi:protein FAR1-related sequence 11 [Tanacetum coccineum]
MKEELPFDLNEVPIDEDVFDSEGQIEEENVDEPFVGQCFLSEEEASIFYQKYAKISGFSVRKGRFENKKGENKGERKRRNFFCHREGKPGDKLLFTLLMKKLPKTILTDQDPWMTQAIAKEMPFTKHAFCIWHITSKFSGWFNSILRGTIPVTSESISQSFVLLYQD